MGKTLVTVRALAAHFGVDRHTVYHWINRGYLRTIPDREKHVKGHGWLILWPQRRPKIKPGPTPRTPIQVSKIAK